jgi:hypothetical protein
MPSAFNLSGEVAQSQFAAELTEVAASVRSFPSVVQFGQYPIVTPVRGV